MKITQIHKKQGFCYGIVIIAEAEEKRFIDNIIIPERLYDEIIKTQKVESMPSVFDECFKILN